MLEQSQRRLFPRLPWQTVDRGRLEGMLDRIPPGGVGLVSAPPGSGKSVLMGQWTRHEFARAHLRVTPAHNDPSVLASELSAAIAAVVPGFEARVADLVSPAGPTAGQSVRAGTLVLALDDLSYDVDILLDDVHQLINDVVCRELEWIVGELPDNVRMVLGARWDPLVRLGDLRLEGRLVEVRGTDLAFNEPEGRALIEAISARDLTDAQAESLVRRADGWAAGLQLAAISLRHVDDIEEFISAFAGSNRLVADYLMQEVIDDIEPDLRRFLLRTSVLEWLSPELCDAVTGDDNAYEMLDLVARRSLFLVPTECGERVRYHHLFADLLRFRLCADDPNEERQLRKAAASWLLDHGHRADAVEQLLAAGESRQVADLITERGREWFEREETDTLVRWLGAAVEMDPDPPAPLLVNLLAAQNAAHDAGATVETYRRIRRRSDLEPGEAAAAAALYAGLGMNDLPSAEIRKAAGEAIDLLETFSSAPVVNVLGLGGRETVELIARAMLAVADLHDGWLAESAERFEALLALPGAQDRIWRPYVMGGLALTVGLAGRCSVAQALARASIEIADASGIAHHHALTYAHFALALVAIDQGDLELLNHHLRESGARVRRTQRHAFAAFQRFLHVEQTLMSRGPTAARAELAASTSFVLEPALVVHLSEAQELRFLMATGRLATAQSLLARDDATSRFPGQVVDLAVARGDVHSARQALERWIPDRVDERTAVERMVRSAAVLAMEGHSSAAGVVLGDALDIAEPHGLRKPFLEQPAALSLLRHQVHPVSHSFARSIVETSAATEARAAALGSLPEPLSDREREVLDYLPTRLSNKQIANALFISVNTLKSHLRHIYTKLEAVDRDAAVAQAGDLGLL